MRLTYILITAFLSLYITPVLAKQVEVVASFTVLADVAKQVGGSHVHVTSLVGNNGDPHEYEPSAKDSKQLSNADVVLISDSRSFETWFERLAKAAKRNDIVPVSKGIQTHQMIENSRNITDPHVWNDPENVKVWVLNIRDALIQADPEDASDFIANANLYIKKLSALDDYAREKFAQTAPNKRKIITSHDAFGYMGSAYDIKFLAPLGVSTETEASAMDVKSLIDQIKKEGVKFYFIENSNDPRLAKQIALETGAEYGGKLYPEALSKEFPSYEAMLKHNVDIISAVIRK